MDKLNHLSNGKRSDEEKRDEKQRDSRMEEQIEKLLHSFGNSMTAEEKLAILAKNFIQLDKNLQKQTSSTKQNDKKYDSLQKEKELLQKEYNKGVLIRDKLEQVCREQQKLMKSIKSESMSKIREEEEKRKEIQSRFQQSLNDIFATLNKNNEENAKLKEVNVEMTKKFKYLAEQYELREKQLEKIHEQINLETQLNEAKLTKLKMETSIEREILLKEKATALEDLLSTKKTIIDMQSREKNLKDQLSLYTDKYEDFQSSLKKSNDIFVSYKAEIDKMTKRTKFLEKDCHEWRSKYEKSNKAILDMAADKQSQDQYIGKSSRQMAQLQKLCRTFQMERTILLDTLKQNNIDRPVLPELPPEPKIEPPPSAADDKLDRMSRNCSELKRTLAELQGQMNALTIEKTKSDETPTSSNSNKKSKNKKSKPKSCPTKEKNQIVDSEEKASSESKKDLLTEKIDNNKLIDKNDTNQLNDLTESKKTDANVEPLNTPENQEYENIHQENTPLTVSNENSTEIDSIEAVAELTAITNVTETSSLETVEESPVTDPTETNSSEVQSTTTITTIPCNIKNDIGNEKEFSPPAVLPNQTNSDQNEKVSGVNMMEID